MTEVEQVSDEGDACREPLVQDVNSSYALWCRSNEYDVLNVKLIFDRINDDGSGSSGLWSQKEKMVRFVWLKASTSVT